MGLIRKPHVLKANKITATPAHVIFFDTETNELPVEKDVHQHVLKLGWACYHRRRGYGKLASTKWFYFDTVEHFWMWALKYCTSHRRVLFLAHNLDFDFLVLDGLNLLLKNKWYARNMIVNGQTDIWTFAKYAHKPDSRQWKAYVRKHRKEPRVLSTALFMDLMNYFVMSLKKLGEAVGVPKMEIDFSTCTMDELSVYCKNDVLIMVRAWEKWINFIEDNDLGVWGKTLPSQAFNAYRHRFMPHKIFIHDHIKSCELERDAYFGGRTECFRIGKFTDGPFHLYDVNSLYPFVMKTHTYPSKMLSYAARGDVSDLKRHISRYGIIAEVLVKIDRPFIPKRLKTRLIFPTGTFWTTLATPELAYLLKHGEVLDVNRVAFYQMARLFADYIEFFWQERVGYKKVGDTAYDLHCKKLMNSLYGKFGQRLDSYVFLAQDPEHKIGYFSEYDMDAHKWVKMKRMNGKVEVWDGKTESYNSFPAIAAHITSNARLTLWQYMLKVRTGRLFYCDTDSLIVDSTASKHLERDVSTGTLGKLHLESTSDTIHVNNVKDYVFASKRRLKGVCIPADKHEGSTFGQWQQVTMKRVLWGQSEPHCYWRYVEKNIAGNYMKGDVSETGIVTPFDLNEA